MESSTTATATKAPIASTSVVPKARVPSVSKPTANATVVHHQQLRLVSKGHAPATTSVHGTTNVISTVTSRPHAPGTAQWASTGHTSSNQRKKGPATVLQKQAVPGPVVTTAPVPVSTSRKSSFGTAASGPVSKTSPPNKPVTPAKRQLFPESVSSRQQLSAAKSNGSGSAISNGKATCSMSYSSVAMAAPGSSGKGGSIVGGQVSPASTS